MCLCLIKGEIKSKVLLEVWIVKQNGVVSFGC